MNIKLQKIGGFNYLDYRFLDAVSGLKNRGTIRQGLKGAFVMTLECMTSNFLQRHH